MKLFKAGLFVFLLLAVCLPAVSQTQIQVNIPFNFFAAGKSLPAGHYAMARAFTANQEVWRLSNQQGGGTAVLVTNSVVSTGKPHRPSFVFHRTGTTYSLIQFWPEGNLGRELPLHEKVKTTILTATSQDVVIEAE